MGQYFCLVNETKKEYAHSPSIAKLWEWAANFGHRLFISHLLNGGWSGDRIALIGDYNEQRITYNDLNRMTEVFPSPKLEDFSDLDAYFEACDKRERKILSLIKDEKVAPVYYCIDRNEYIAVSEADGDETNVLGALLYLIAFSFEKEDELPNWEEIESIAPSRWAFCRIEAHNDIPPGARSITKEAIGILKEEAAYRERKEREQWKEYVERTLIG